MDKLMPGVSSKQGRNNTAFEPLVATEVIAVDQQGVYLTSGEQLSREPSPSASRGCGPWRWRGRRKAYGAERYADSPLVSSSSSLRADSRFCVAKSCSLAKASRGYTPSARRKHPFASSRLSDLSPAMRFR